MLLDTFDKVICILLRGLVLLCTLGDGALLLSSEITSGVFPFTLGSGVFVSHSCPSDKRALVLMCLKILVRIAAGGKSGMGVQLSSVAFIEAPFAHDTWMGLSSEVIFNKFIFPLEQ
eukprot:15365610-Ditylum_brightwellii.AAC.2